MFLTFWSQRRNLDKTSAVSAVGELLFGASKLVIALATTGICGLYLTRFEHEREMCKFLTL